MGGGTTRFIVNYNLLHICNVNTWHTVAGTYIYMFMSLKEDVHVHIYQSILVAETPSVQSIVSNLN